MDIDPCRWEYTGGKGHVERESCKEESQQCVAMHSSGSQHIRKFSALAKIYLCNAHDK